MRHRRPWKSFLRGPSSSSPVDTQGAGVCEGKAEVPAGRQTPEKGRACPLLASTAHMMLMAQKLMPRPPPASRAVFTSPLQCHTTSGTTHLRQHSSMGASQGGDGARSPSPRLAIHPPQWRSRVINARVSQKLFPCSDVHCLLLCTLATSCRLPWSVQRPQELPWCHMQAAGKLSSATGLWILSVP